MVLLPKPWPFKHILAHGYIQIPDMFACRLSSLGACLNELRLHDNLIRGPLLPGLAGLSTLHTLDLRGNRITSVEVG